MNENEELTMQDLRNNQHWVGIFFILVGMFFYFSANNLMWALVAGGLGVILLLNSEKIKSKIKHEEEEAIGDEISFSEIASFYRKNKKILIYLAMAFIVLAGFYIRFSNVKYLGDQLLGLDPYIFLRYAQYYVDTGSIPHNDTLRYYPEGYDTRSEGTLHSYVNAWVYLLLKPFFPNVTLVWIFQIYPAVFGALSFISFFFLVQELFKDYRTSLVSTAFLSVVPGFIFRTAGGFADKEAIAIFLIFTALLFFVRALNKNGKMSYVYAALSGLFTGLGGLSWGGIVFVFSSISIYILTEIALDRIKNKTFNIFLIWSIVSLPILAFATNRYGGLAYFINPSAPYNNFLMQIVGGMINFARNLMVVPVLLAVFLIVYRKVAYRFVAKKLPVNMPVGIGLFATGIVLALAVSFVIFGYDFMKDTLNSIVTIFQAGPRSRHAESVSENQVPVFYNGGVSWMGSLGWAILPYFLGVFALSYEFFSAFKKQKLILSLGIFTFVCFLFFSNFSNLPQHAWVREVFGGYYTAAFYLLLLGLFIFYLKVWRDKEKIEELKPALLLLLVWNILGILAGRTAVRNIFSATPSILIISAYGLVKLIDFISSKTRDKLYIGSITLLVLLFVLANYLTMLSVGYATVSQGYRADVYEGDDWDRALDWIKANTPQDAVFIHWWDYGYWVQSLGERATVLDGGNYRPPDYAAEKFFTSNNESEYAKVLEDYARPSYLLIVDDDIPKFYQIARIGLKDVWFSTFYLQGVDRNIVKEAQNASNMLVYVSSSGAAPTTQDIVYNNVLFPVGSTYVTNILAPINETNAFEPVGFLSVSNTGQSTMLPFNCRCVRGSGCIELRSNGIKECYVDWGLTAVNNGLSVPAGMIFLPNITMDMLFTKLYVTEEKVPGFELVYDNGVPKDIQNLLNYRTNIQIWKINYEEFGKVGQ